MLALSDPDKVHKYLVILMLLVAFPTWLVAMSYLKILGRFYDELKQKEPDVWQTIGAPTLANMVLLPFWRFRKYYTFYPVLKERATSRGDEYRYARPAYRLLNTGFIMFSILFVLVGLIIFWIIYHDL